MPLMRVFGSEWCRVELHVLPSIFRLGKTTKSEKRFLINSGNEYLIGANLPYFPRGGLKMYPYNVFFKQEHWQKSSSWGGLSAGSDMLFPVQVLDGEVFQMLGGKNGELKKWIEKNVPSISVHKSTNHLENGRHLRDPDKLVRCVTGSVVWTPCFPVVSHLESTFSNGILHTVAPYNDVPHRDELLKECYTNCLNKAAAMVKNEPVLLSTVLLGTGLKSIDIKESSRALIRSLLDMDKDLDVVVELVMRPIDGLANQINILSQLFEDSGFKVMHP